MKKVIFAVMFGLLVLGSIVAYAATCNIELRTVNMSNVWLIGNAVKRIFANLNA